MLPPGHIAAGYLTAYALIKIVRPDISPGEINQLLYWGMFFGFAPDLDKFWFFFKNRSLLVVPAGVKKYHRNYFTHAPVLWLAVGLGIFLFAQTGYLKLLGLVLWLGAWSHFILDSLEYGVIWLWPISDKLFAFKSAGVKLFVTEDKNFFTHSFKFLHAYATKSITFYCEIIIILIALIIYLK